MTRIKWCLHPKDRVAKIKGTDFLWCGRCGSMWCGDFRKNGSKEWRTPQISRELNLSRHSA